jgi:hypothetical protein
LIGIQRAINYIRGFYNESEVKKNVGYIKILVVKKGEILSKDKKWEL